MRKLLNTLYVTLPEAYLSLDGENVVVLEGEEEKLRVPLHNLEQIVTFGYTGASPALMGTCASHGVDLCFMTVHGRFLARVSGETHGNVVLRTTQYQLFTDESFSLQIARDIISAKLANSRWVMERTLRDHPMRVDTELLHAASDRLQKEITDVRNAKSIDQLRGMEGTAASEYFGTFSELIINQRESFTFDTRNRRPPLDPVNALLSFAYALLSNDVKAALETVGLDPYVGFMHTLRPGRPSLALDLMEELRAPIADRFVLTLINQKAITASGFTKTESGAVRMDDETRKKVLIAWQTRKQESITHPFLKEKLPWGLVPFAQALLLARYLRGDLDAYPVFLWK